MSYFADDLVTLFQDASLGTFGVDIFTGAEAAIPFLPSGTIHIRDTGGSGIERTQNKVTTPAYLNPSAQIMCRAATKVRAKALAQACFDKVLTVKNAMIAPADYSSYTFYREINPLQSEPIDLGADDRKQFRYAVNVIATKRP